MFGFWKKQAYPERDFEQAINTAIRRARRDGVSEANIASFLISHGESARRIRNAIIESRKYGSPQYVDASR
jgi:hypothetical protein